MRYLFLSLVLALLLSMGASLPAAAGGPVREGFAERWSTGARVKAVHRSVWRHHPRQARASFWESYAEGPPRRHFHRHVATPSRYAKRRHARVAKPMRHHQRTARRPVRGRSVHHRPAPTHRAVAAPTITPPSVGPNAGPKAGKSVGSDGHKPAGTLGMASYYWQPQVLASGGRFDPNALTAAHKTLPFGTRVRVTHLGNGRSVEVKINDRGPYVAGRIIDLSRAAAGVIGMSAQGVARVVVEILGK
jgi:rare lipoprotein A